LRIRSLEIAGFKSFPARVSLAFPDGICAIVGPNGCGKSNLVDAIRWVMGEQNPRHLRGRAMEDMIFNGTDTQAPVGMAEVVLTLSNPNGTAPAEYNAFSEIQITRRLYRDGESEYQINRVPCRLRDVVDFFLDTGVGTRGYTIVEQGRIAEIVSTRPQDRRVIIEEAAGIGKYRQRRRETERKLESTEQNLVRVSDILGELRRQIGMLERQSRKAHRYRELSGRVRALDLSLAREDLDVQEAELVAARGELESLRARSTETDRSLAEAEARLGTSRDERIRLEGEVRRIGERLHELRAQIQGVEGRISYEGREREELLSLAGTREEEIGELQRQSEQHRANEVQAHRERSELETRLQHEERDAGAQKAELEQTSEGLAGLQGRREALTRRLLDLSTEGAGLESRIDSKSEQRRDRERRLGGHDENVEAGTVQIELAGQEEDALQARLGGLLAGRESLGRNLAGLLGQRQQATERRAELESELEGVRERRDRAAARLQSLEEAEAEAAQMATRAIESLEEPSRQRIRGLLADVLEVREGFERAVESVLGARLQALLVDTPQDALTLLETLRTSDSGRATLLSIASESRGAESGFVPLGRPLLEFVDAKPPYRGLLPRLLGDAYLVEDLAEAFSRFGLESLPAVFVTRNGDLLDRTGTLTGGTRPAAGLVSRAAEIRATRSELETLDAGTTRREGDRRAALEHETGLERDIENTRSRYHAAELAVLQHEKDLERTRERRKAVAELLEDSRNLKAGVVDEIDHLDQEIRDQRERAEAVGRERTAVEREVATVSAEIGERARVLERLEKGMVERQVALASLQERRDQLAASHERLRSALQESEEWIRRRHEEVAAARERAEAFAVGIAEAKAQLTRDLEEEETLRGRQQTAHTEFEQSDQSVEDLEQEIRRVSRERDSVRERIGAEELHAQELRLALERTADRARERYGVDLLTYEVPAEERDRPREERSNEITRLRSSLEALGPVHHGAIEEYEEISERFRYLSEQKADIEASVERLRNAIARINRTSRTRFRETFEAVNAEFKKIFPRLFQGGRAYLSLTEGEDVLEAGIEIVAQPPGKKLQNMNLLSGGEKAMTALALLFAVFNVKPSPFFLLDEVDAALDDLNVGRFDELMREMAPQSQFLLITHNKSTIETADRLYGVTMEEPGASKVVTVQLVS
jgi:chromosome segregation protein